MKTKLLSVFLTTSLLIIGFVILNSSATSIGHRDELAMFNEVDNKNQSETKATNEFSSFFEIFSDQSKALPPPDLEINNVGGGYSTDIQNGVKTFLRCTTNEFASGFFEFEDPNQATYPPGTTFLIEWGQAGETDTTIPPTYRYFPGIYTLTYTVTFPNGTSESNTFRVFVGTEPPAPSVTLIDGNDNCLPNEYNYRFSVNENRPGTTYTITINDGSAPRIINSEDYTFGDPIDEVFTHTFTNTSCGINSTINGTPFANSFSISVTATNPCNTSGNFISTGPIRVSEPTEADFVRPSEIACVNSVVNFSDISFSGENATSSGCNNNYERYWEIVRLGPGPGGFTVDSGVLGDNNGVPNDWPSWNNGTEDIGVSFDTAGDFRIRITTGNNCGTSTITKDICIIPEVISEFTLSQDEACFEDDQIVSTDNISQASGCDITPQYTWVVTQSNPDCPPTTSPGWEFVSGGPNSFEPEFRFTAPGVYTIRLELFIEDILPGENCRDDVFERVITIKDRPKAELTDIIACEGEPFTIDPVINDCYSSPTTYDWNFGPSASITTSTDPNPSISYATTGTYNYTLEVTNECGPRTYTGNIEIRPPSVVQADGPLTSCVDQEIALDGNISGGSGDGIWTANIPGGTFNPSDQAIDPTYTPPLGYNGIITFTFSSDNTGIFCSDVSDTHDVLIESGASVDAGMDETICADGSVVLNGSFGGTATGIEWSSPEGTFSDITDPSANFTPPAGFVGTLTLSLTTTGTVGLCPPITDTVDIEVLPEGQVDPMPDEILCNLEILPELQFTSSNTSVITNFEWSIDTNIGLTPLNGAGNLPSFQAQNLTDSPVVATVTVTPIVESGSVNCPGPTETFTITVNPSPSIQDDSLSLCDGETFNYTPTNGGGNILPSGTTYTWATPVSNPVGAITGGSAEFTPQTSISQIISNSTPNPASITYTITPTSDEGCQGDPFELTINFPEQPVVQNIPLDLCSDESFSITPDASLAGNQIPAGTLYTWSAPSITPAGGATGGTAQTTPVGSIDQQLTNTTDGIVTAVYTVTPTLNGCLGDPFEVELTLRPRPVIQNYNPTICSGDTFNVDPENILPNIVPIGTRYTWTAPSISNPGAISGASDNTIPLNEISQTLINSSANDVTVTYEVTPQSGSCSGDSFFINVVVEPTPFINDIQESVCTGGTFEVIPVTNGSDIVPANTTYTWGTPISNPPGAVTGGSAETDPQTSISQNLTNTTEDIATLTYTVTPTSGNCAGDPFEVVVTLERAGDIVQEPEPLQSICVGGQPNTLIIDLLDGNTSTTSIQWYTNTNASTIGGTPIAGATSLSYQPPVINTPGTYFYYVEVVPLGVQCLPDVSQLSTIEVVPDPVINAQQMNNQELCLGATPNTLSVQTSGGVGQLNYQWFVSDTADTTTGTPIANAVTNSFTPPTNQIGTNFYYVVISQNASGCEVTSNPARIRVEPQPVINQQPQAQEVCLGAASNLMSVNVNFSIGTPTYQWYENDENSNQGGTPIAGANQATFLPPTASEGEFYYYVIVSFSNSSCGPLRSNPARLNVVPLAELNPIDNFEVCTGDIIPRINFSTTAPSMLHTFSWTNSNPAIGLVANGVGNIPEFNAVNTSGVTQTATITVESQSIFGGDSCGNDITEFTITVASEIVDNAVVSDYNGNQISCSGANDGSIQITPEGGVPISINQPYLFNWTGPNGFTSNQEDIFNLGSGIYDLKITDSFGCIYNFSYEMEEPDELVVVGDSVSNIICHGELTGEILITVTGGTGDYSYQWLKDGFIFADTQDLENIGAGFYTLIVTDENGCNPPRPRQFEITQPTPIEIEVLDKSAIVCSDEIVIPGSENKNKLVDEFNGFISIEVEGGTPFQSASGELSYQYEWKNEINDIISTDKNLTGVGPGSYTVDVYDKLTCLATETVELIMPDPIEIEIDADNETCAFNQDGSIALDIEGGTPPFNVIWDSGQNGAIINNLAPGTYTAEITDRFNCKNTVSVDIEGVNPVEVEANFEDITCFGEADGYIDVNVEGGRPIDIVSYEYSWTGPDGFTSSEPSLSNLEAGTYSLVVNDAIGCEKTVEVEIQEPEQLDVGFETTQVNCFGVDDGTITLFIEGGSPPYTSNYGDFEGSTYLIEGLEPNSYTVEVMDSNGCMDVLEIEIDQEFLTEIEPPTGEPVQEFCFEDQVTVSDIRVSGDGIRWYLSPMDDEALSNDYLITQNSVFYARNFDPNTNCLSGETLRVEVNLIDGIIDVNNYITVNGNNLNDNLNVVNIELFPDNEMLIYNRYGKLVWETTGYNNTDNTFRGESNVGGTIGQSNFLPTGTYFYILNYRSPCNNDIKKGYLQIDNNN